MTKNPDAMVLAKATVDPALVEAKSGLELIQDFSVENDDDETFAVEVLQDVKVKHALIEKKRKSITEPLNKALKEVNNLFRPVREALEEAEKLLKGKLADYLDSKNKANETLLLEAKNAATASEAVEKIQSMVAAESAKSVSVRWVWRAEVINASMVPSEYLSPDLALIEEAMNATAKELGEPIPIPGVRFSKDSIVTVRKAS